MAEEYIKTYEGQVIGILETTSVGDQIARNFPARQIVGYYRKSQNVTTDFYGRVVARGNTVVNLIYKDRNH